MARIPQHIVDQIYNAVDIVDIVSDYVPLKKKGANLWALSPFSNEKTPSFAVNPVKGIYKDFGASGKGGDAINFLMEVEGYTYVEALKHAAKKYGITIEEEEETQEQLEAKDKRQSLFIVNEFAGRFFQDQLLKSEEGKKIGLSYFKERGILQSTIEEFQLGYSPDAWEAFAQEALAKQYKDEYLLELGLVSRSQKTGKLLDRFRGRVMFPITNPLGKIVGFGGRILGNRKDVGKYINSPESPIYHKSQILYGLYQAKKHIRDQDQCILTEGYMDTIVLHQNGIKHVVASSGTALTTEQIRLIRRFTQNVLMIYDGDNAGIKAALRGMDLLLKEGMAPKVIVLPDKHDPDSYVTEKGSQAFLDYVANDALSFIEFKMRVMMQGKDKNDPQAQADLVKGLAETLANVGDRVQRQMYVKHVAQLVDITEGLMTHAVEQALQVRNKLEARERRREQQRKPGEPAEVKELKSFEQLELATQEKEILRVLVNHHDQGFTMEDVPLETPEGEAVEEEEIPLTDFFMVELEGLVFENQTNEQLKLAIFEEYDLKGQVDIQRYLSHERDDFRKLVSDLLLPRHEISPNWKKHGAFVLELDENMRKTVVGPIFHYKSKKVERLLKECREKLKAAEEQKDDAELDRLLTLNMRLMQMRQEIHQRLGTDGAISGRDGVL
ncbi:MAG: DNA primase [Bacteroidota bacterium]